MKLKKRDLIWIVVIPACIIVTLDSIRPLWAFPAEEGIEFECIKYNETQLVMEPSTRYICWTNQTCVIFTDPNCNGLFVVYQIHPDMCLESVAHVGNATITCNGTVAECEYLHNRRK